MGRVVADKGRSIVPGKREKDEERIRVAEERTLAAGKRATPRVLGKDETATMRWNRAGRPVRGNAKRNREGANRVAPCRLASRRVASRRPGRFKAEPRRIPAASNRLLGEREPPRAERRRGMRPRRNSTLIAARYTRRDTSGEISGHRSTGDPELDRLTKITLATR